MTRMTIDGNGTTNIFPMALTTSNQQGTKTVYSATCVWDVQSRYGRWLVKLVAIVRLYDYATSFW